jgi:hypothetical protein
MTRNDKTPVAAGVCHCAETCLVCECKLTIPAPEKQPRPGTALCSFLRRYRAELDAWGEQHGDRQSGGLIDCCTALLNEAERGRHDA